MLSYFGQHVYVELHQQAERNFSPELQVGKRVFHKLTVHAPGSNYRQVEGIVKQWPEPFFPLIPGWYMAKRRSINASHSIIFVYKIWLLYLDV